MFIRFETNLIDDSSHRPKGILTLAHDLLDDGKFDKADDEMVRGLLKWFSHNLLVPKALKLREHDRAISWFRPEAKVQLEKMYELVAVLERYGVPVTRKQTRDPGIIVYDDLDQVVAKPRRKRLK